MKVKKRIKISIAILAIALVIMACGGKSTESNETMASIVVKTAADTDDGDGINFEAEDHSVKYLKHEIGTDWEGKSCLIYYYTFTNKGDEPANAVVAAYIACKQDGEKCKQTFLKEGLEASDNTMKEIEPGESIEACNIYLLKDKSEVTLEASDWTSSDDKKSVQKIKIE